MELRQDLLERFLWLAKERYSIKLRRDAGLPPPWTEDRLLQKYHFCNVFRRDDRTSRVIYEKLRRCKTPAAMFLQAACGRLVNKAETIQKLAPFWGSFNIDSLELALTEHGINTQAYRLNTPLGLNNRRGVALQIAQTFQGCEEQAQLLLTATSLKRAHNCVRQGWGPFIGYQIVQDLHDCGFWSSSIDDDTWAYAGNGAVRAALSLLGRDIDYDWKSSFFQGCKSNPEFIKLTAEVMQAVTLYMKQHWPVEWPIWTIHETEFMLCELDKYIRKSSSGQPSGRLFRSGR